MSSTNSTAKTLGIISVATLGAVVILAGAAALVWGGMHGFNGSGGSLEATVVSFDGSPFLYHEALWVDVPSAAVRPQPSPLSSPTTHLNGGTELREIEEHGDWVHVALADGSTGWVHEDLVDDDRPGVLFVKVAATAVRASRLPVGRTLARLEAGAAVQRLARAGDTYQVRLADGRVGFVARAAVTDDQPENVVVAIPQATLFSSPGSFARVTTSVPYGTRMVAFDEEDDHYLVRTADGALGWIDEDSVSRVRG